MAGNPRKLSDGAIINSNLGVQQSNRSVQHYFSNASKIYVGQIKAVSFTDAPDNISKRFVEYSIQVSEDSATTSLYHSCRALDSFGDNNNFAERIYQPITEGKQGKKDDKEIFVYKNGAMVLVSFIGGNRQSPFILGALQHPSIGLEKITTEVSEFIPTGSSKSRDQRLTKLCTVVAGSKESDTDNGGQRILGEYQGLRWNINKDGELTILYQGPKNSTGTLLAPETQPTVIKINKDGEILFIDNLDQEIKISRKDQKILISSGNSTPDVIEIDRANKNIRLDCGNDESHETGKVWKVRAGKQAILASPRVSVGGVGAGEPLVLGNTWMAFYNAMIAAQLNPLIVAVTDLKASHTNHVHQETGTWTGGISPGNPVPTRPPPLPVPSIPPPAPVSTPAQYSSFCFTKKAYSGS